MSYTFLSFLYSMNKFRWTYMTKSTIRISRFGCRISRQTRSLSRVSKRQAELDSRHCKAVEPQVNNGEKMRDNVHFDDIRSIKKTKKVKIIPVKYQSAPQPSSELTQFRAKSIHVKKTPGSECKNIEKFKNSPKSSLTCTDRLMPIDTVLRLPSIKMTEEQGDSKPLNLQKVPYVHHFDTYTLVKRINDGGFTFEQSITTMKAIRALLAMNLQSARASLVSKSDFENETYLFRAACSELRTEIRSIRWKNEESTRRERTLLHHEVDILTQKLSQELLALKEELKGMFDDRKMSVRIDQRSMESQIQELNYKITVLLKSDSKSEVEGLRWILTRRSVMGILFMAFMVLTSLQYASYKSHENELRKKRETMVKLEESIDTLPVQSAAEILAAG